MTVRRVNPTKQIALPKEIEENPSLKKFYDEFLFNVFQLRERSGGDSDLFDDITSNEPIGHTLAKLFDIREQIGSGIPVTIDTTGFTIDTTEQTTDMTEV